MTSCTGRASATAPIGIFDSGVGGLSVWRSIRQALPGEDLLYLADSGCAPYGDRSAGWIQARTALLAQYLLDQGCKAIVIACNTATMVAASFLRARFAVPIIAIEPAVKPAAALSRSRCIALMATSRTMDSPGLQQLVRHHAAGVDVIRIPCPGLADRVDALPLVRPELPPELRPRLDPRCGAAPTRWCWAARTTPSCVPPLNASAGAVSRSSNPPSPWPRRFAGACTKPAA
ncbi:glutamate racemase [Alcaligenes sp. Marseille-Q7550]